MQISIKGQFLNRANFQKFLPPQKNIFTAGSEADNPHLITLIEW